MLAYAIIFISLALVFYTIGVWSEKKQGTLKKWHVVIFWVGLLCDTLGTSAMSKIAGIGFKLNFHGVTGLLAILLMLFHAVWATIVLIKNEQDMKIKFHKFSIVVWVIWLIPFLSGAIYGMTK
ncbi:TIGR03987 family protein [Clostridium niameyense]|uniref:TIGR03987 family protein n=1 Tax=Clostridium niameyense TaxID=1622073 RepID=A0A6M0R9W1_9CLOT|nr:HsmA family protein [Clostridium niameyense]NEZ46577.1 TIGR03987 family protein [Clostridium niameyense]